MNVKFVTLGCKTNQYETNAMEQSFKNAGYDIDENKKPDIYVVNTCSVTSVAERKSRQMIRRAKELNKDAIVVVCGCYSQVAKSEIEKIDDVNIIIGINEKNKIVEIVEDYIKKHRNLKCNLEKRDDINNFKKYADKNNLDKCDGIEKLDKIEFKDIKCEEVSDVMHDDKFLDFGPTTYTELTRAYIKIQDGCDRFCSYCIIPYARGRVRSREPESILNEITEVAKKGIKEVVLTGIHIASYGKDFSDKNENSTDEHMDISDEQKENCDEYGKDDLHLSESGLRSKGKDELHLSESRLRSKEGDELHLSKSKSRSKEEDDLHSGSYRLIDLLEQINKIDGIERVRLGSIEPKLINKEFVERLSKLDKICHHFHLSLQSGCDGTLKRMNRRYTTAEFEQSAKMLRNAFDDVHLTTDIIVGFPGETEKEFETTYEFLKKIKFYKTHIFKYSPRRGTAAEKMPNQVDGKIKEERSKTLIELSNKNELDYNQSYIGKDIAVLIEEKEGDFYKGHTGNYILSKVKSDKDIVNKIVKVRVYNAEEEFVEAK